MQSRLSDTLFYPWTPPGRGAGDNIHLTCFSSHNWITTVRKPGWEKWEPSNGRFWKCLLRFFLYPKQNIFSVAVINKLLVCVFMVTNNSQSKKLPERVYIPSNPHFCSRWRLRKRSFRTPTCWLGRKVPFWERHTEIQCGNNTPTHTFLKMWFSVKHLRYGNMTLWLLQTYSALVLTWEPWDSHLHNQV